MLGSNGLNPNQTKPTKPRQLYPVPLGSRTEWTGLFRSHLLQNEMGQESWDWRDSSLKPIFRGPHFRRLCGSLVNKFTDLSLKFGYDAMLY